MSKPRGTKWLCRIGIICLLFLSCQAVNPVLIHFESDTPSASHGESWQGSLEHGKRMPSSGENFSGVSHLLMALGRNGVHSELRKAVLAAYDTKPKASNTALAFDASSLPLSFYPNSTRQNMDRKLRTLALSIKKLAAAR